MRRCRQYFDDDKEPAWFYLIFAGIFGDLARAGTRLFRHGCVSMLAEAREQRRYEVGQELKSLLVVAGALAGIFGCFFALYVLVAYVIAQVLRYVL